MRIKRSVARFFTLMILPAVTIAVVGYFGAYGIWGERGVLALEDTKAKLGVARTADLVEELARTRLMDGAPGQVAVPRDAH